MCLTEKDHKEVETICRDVKKVPHNFIVSGDSTFTSEFRIQEVTYDVNHGDVMDRSWNSCITRIFDTLYLSDVHIILSTLRQFDIWDLIR